MERVHTLLFYQFVQIDDPQQFAEEHLAFCNGIGLLGRILIGNEGLNGSVCGTEEQVEQYKAHLRADDRFKEIVFKEDVGLSNTFTKMRVLVKDEILALKQQIDISKKAPYITPKELKELYESGEDFVILDTRNDYEWKVGAFKNARVMPIKTFREFPEMIAEMKDELKGKKIVTYCTGGIRCEKATAYMKEHGFEDEEVYQLQDGIITFCKEFPDTYWEGKCFVFDKRMMEDYNSVEKPITSCEVCDGNCDLYKNCRNTACDRYVVLCVNCQKELHGCCSKDCYSVFRAECTRKSRLQQNKPVTETQ